MSKARPPTPTCSLPPLTLSCFSPHTLSPFQNPLQQHVPQSIRNLNYPSCLWAGRCSPSLALWGEWLDPLCLIFIFSHFSVHILIQHCLFVRFYFQIYLIVVVFFFSSSHRKLRRQRFARSLAFVSISIVSPRLQLQKKVHTGSLRLSLDVQISPAVPTCQMEFLMTLGAFPLHPKL